MSEDEYEKMVCVCEGSHQNVIEQQYEERVQTTKKVTMLMIRGRPRNGFSNI